MRMARLHAGACWDWGGRQAHDHDQQQQMQSILHFPPQSLNARSPADLVRSSKGCFRRALRSDSDVFKRGTPHGRTPGDQTGRVGECCLLQDRAATIAYNPSCGRVGVYPSTVECLNSSLAILPGGVVVNTIRVKNA